MKHTARVRAHWLAGVSLVAGAAGLLCCQPGMAEQAANSSANITSYERKVTTMDEACNLRKNLVRDPKGLKGGNPKAMQGPNAPYAEGSFSSAAYREKTSSTLRRMQEQAFGNNRGPNMVASNAVASNAVAKVQAEVKAPANKAAGANVAAKPKDIARAK
jgi:hypothetical protein